jgi:hypothetical protein
MKDEGDRKTSMKGEKGEGDRKGLHPTPLRPRPYKEGGGAARAGIRRARATALGSAAPLAALFRQCTLSATGAY